MQKGSIERDSHGHATNLRPLDFSITKNVFVVMILVVVLCFFSSILRSHTRKELSQKVLASFRTISGFC